MNGRLDRLGTWGRPVLAALMGVALLTSAVTSNQTATAAPALATSTFSTTDSLWVGGTPMSTGYVGVCQSPTSASSLADCFASVASTWSQNKFYATATDGVNVYFAGTGGGLSCPVSGAGTNCTQIAAGPWNGADEVTALAASGGDLWIGQDNGDIYQCPTDVPYSSGSSAPSQCTLLDDAGKRSIDALILANGTLYAGLSSLGIETKNQGLLWKCDAQTPNSCTNLDGTGGNVGVISLTAGAGYVWAGLGSGELWRCDPTATNSCDNWDQAGGVIKSVSYDGQGTIYAAIAENSNKKNGVIWSCPTATENACDNVASNLENPSAVAAGPDNVFWSNSSPPLNYGTSAYAGAALNRWQDASAVVYLPAEGPTGVGAVSVRVRPGPRGFHHLARLCSDGGRKPVARLRIKGPHGAVVTRRAGLCRLSHGKAVRVNADLLDPGTHRVKARFTGIAKRPITRSKALTVKQDRTVRVNLRCPDHG